MAYITLNRQKLRHNYEFLQRLFRRNGIEWVVVSKLLCGNRLFLDELIKLGVRQMCDSRITNLKVIKNLDPTIQTIYIKPASIRWAADVVRYADISFNTEHRTLQKLSEEAVRQGKEHQVVIMIELGERREGIMRHKLLTFYEKASALPNIRIIGIGTNFTCLSGILPSSEKLSQLVWFRNLIAERFGDFTPYVSGGTSVTIPLLKKYAVPAGVNHFRVGETLFFGTDVYHNKPLRGMCQDVFCLYAVIIELIEKPKMPDGETGQNLEGHVPEFPEEDYGKTSYRAILDVGLLDTDCTHLTPEDPTINYIGASSDMLVIDLGTNPKGYKTGDAIRFRIDYLGTLRLMNSRYIRKEIVSINATTINATTKSASRSSLHSASDMHPLRVGKESGREDKKTR